jgi:hypothetical protein
METGKAVVEYQVSQHMKSGARAPGRMFPLRMRKEQYQV